MTEEEILDVIKRFAFVAKIAREANFSGIQLHSDDPVVRRPRGNRNLHKMEIHDNAPLSHSASIILIVVDECRYVE